MLFGGPRAAGTYCHDQTNPIALFGVSDLVHVAEYEIGKACEMENACCGEGGLCEHRSAFALYQT